MRVVLYKNRGGVPPFPKRVGEGENGGGVIKVDEAAEHPK